MKDVVKTIAVSFAGAAASVLGMCAGFAAYEAMSNPVKRAGIKKRFVDIKDAIIGKEDQ